MPIEPCQSNSILCARLVILRFFLIHQIGKLTLSFAEIRCDAAIYIRKDLKSTFSRVGGQFFSSLKLLYFHPIYHLNSPNVFFALFCFVFLCVCVGGGSEETSTFTQSLLVTYKRDSVKLSRHKSVHLQRNKPFCKEKNKLFNLNHLK